MSCGGMFWAYKRQEYAKARKFGQYDFIPLIQKEQTIKSDKLQKSRITNFVCLARLINITLN